jgi:hypothetical protein
MSIDIKGQKFLTFRSRLYWWFWGCDIFLQGVPVLKLTLLLNILFWGLLK